ESGDAGMNAQRFTVIYSQNNRPDFLICGFFGILALAVIDSFTTALPRAYIYLMPILIVAGFLARPWIAFIVFVCAALTAGLSHYQLRPAATLFVTAWVGFTGTGFFVPEVA